MYFRKFGGHVATLIFLLLGVTACGGGGGGSVPASTSLPNTPSITGLPILSTESNVLRVTVDAGPANSGANVNRLYTTVTVCQAGSATLCQTIDHVLVDTGSAGLRLLSSAMAPALSLNRLTGSSGLPVLNCVQFLDNSFAWGPVKVADVALGSKVARNVSIQVIADPAFDRLSAACSVSGTSITNVVTLGANGIIGLGLSKEDCGSGCAANPRNGFYYSCTDANCSATQGIVVSTDNQVKNPVPLFASDNNGILIDLPAANLTGESSLSGSLIFGIGTQANNQLAAGVVLSTDALGYFTTVFSGQLLNTSLIDSGSNGLFFDSAVIPECGSGGPGFYCPASRLALSATLRGTNSGSSAEVSFFVDNAIALFASGAPAVLPSLAGTIGDSHTFDWGLPFFYGRRVFVGIENQPSVLGMGPFYAF